MAENNKKPNPAAFIAIGTCFLGAGVALGAALYSRGSYGAGIGLIGIGVMFIIIGVARKQQSKTGTDQ